MRSLLAPLAIVSVAFCVLALRVDDDLEAVLDEEAGTNEHTGAEVGTVGAAKEQGKHAEASKFVMDAETIANIKTFERNVEAGAAFEAKASCAELGVDVKDAFVKLESTLQELLAEEDDNATVPKELSEKAFQHTQIFVGFANIADEKGCLVSAMTAEGVQDGINGLLQAHMPRFPRHAYEVMLAWMYAIGDLAPMVQEREAELYFPEDVEKSGNCPAPCGICTRSHNSWRKGQEPFKFKCLLQKGQLPPVIKGAGLNCTEPRRRRSFWRPHWYGRKSWCYVTDWQKKVCHKMAVTAAVACGPDPILRQIDKANFSSEDAEKEFQNFKYCVNHEMLYAQDDTRGTYLNRKYQNDRPDRTLDAFSMMLSLGLANGIAALRDRAALQPQGKADAFLDVFMQPGYSFNESFRSQLSSTPAEYDSRCPEVTATIELCRPEWRARNKNLMQRVSSTLWHTLWMLSAPMLIVAFGTMALGGNGCTETGGCPDWWQSPTLGFALFWTALSLAVVGFVMGGVGLAFKLVVGSAVIWTVAFNAIMVASGKWWTGVQLRCNPPKPPNNSWKEIMNITG